MNFDELLQRGRAAFKAFLAARPKPMPLGIEGVSAVKPNDFDGAPTACREYVRTSQSLFILDEDGNIELLLCKAKPRDDL